MSSHPPFWRSRKVLALGVLTVALGIVEGYVIHRVYDAREADALEAAQAAVQTAADGRANLIEPWVASIVGGAQVVASYPSLSEVLTSAPARPRTDFDGRTVAAHAASLLDTFIRLQGYRAASVSDRAGRQIVGSGAPLPSSLVRAVRRGWRESGGQMVDLFLAGDRPLVVAAVSVPLDSPPERALGVVLLATDPVSWLYPQLATDSSSTLTAEYLLVRGSRSDPVLLSPPRDLVRPLPVHTFPRADIAWTTSIAGWRPVAGTPWAVVAKVDRFKVVAEFRGAARGVLFQALTYLAVLLTFIFAMLHRRQTLHAAEQREATRRIALLNRLLLTLSEVNELMVRETDRQRLLDETCRIIVEHGGFRMAWVGEGTSGSRVVPLASAGIVDGYLDDIDIRSDDTPAGRGPVGISMRERRTVAVNDVATDPSMDRWRARALERRFRSAVAVPLITGDRVWGALTVYSQERAVFQGEALSLLERLARNLAFALDVVEGEARHRETEQVLREREEQLRHAQKMEAVGRLAGGVAHDFNNLLMAISGYTELALTARTEESRRERLQEIGLAADRAANLTRQLLAFSRKQMLQPKVLDLNHVVTDIHKMLYPLLGENIEVTTQLEPALHKVRADPGQMEQMLVNLAVNARDAMPDGGRLLIATRNVNGLSAEGGVLGELQPGHYVELTVTDTGEGIPQEVLEHVFEPFFTTKELGKGTGLGLSTVYGIVKQSGGAITVESAARAGTTFRVYLPVATGDAEAVPEKLTPRVAPAGGERLLVVEDNAAVRRFVRQTLSDAGYVVTDAESAEEALELLSEPELAFDLLLTDIVLPKMDGYELSRLAAGARPSLKTLFMSGYADSPKLREAALHEGVDLIDKPFTSAAIAARVREVLDRPAHVS